MENTDLDTEEFFEEEEKEFDASNSKTVNDARKRAVRIKQKRANFVREMMDSENGRMWVYDLLVMGHIAEPTFTAGDPYHTAFKEGERNIINKILSDINEYAPDMYVKMLKEGKTEK